MAGRVEKEGTENKEFKRLTAMTVDETQQKKTGSDEVVKPKQTRRRAMEEKGTVRPDYNRGNARQSEQLRLARAGSITRSMSRARSRINLQTVFPAFDAFYDAAARGLVKV